MNDRPPNGNQLRDYRITKLEEVALTHEERMTKQDEHMRSVEDALLRVKAGGITTKQLIGIVASIITTLVTLSIAYLNLIK